MKPVTEGLPVPIAVFLEAINEHAIVSITDAAGLIVYANDRFCQISGYGLPELIGQSHRVIKSGVHPAVFYRDLWTTIVSGKIWQGEVCNRARDGSLYWVKSSITPVLDGHGLPTHYISVRTDVTEQKRSAEQVYLLANELDELFRIAPVGIARLEVRRFDKVNDLFAAMLGYAPGELLGLSTRSIYPSEEIFNEIGTAAYEGVRDRGYFRGEFCLRKKEGGELWVLAGVCSLTPDDPMHNTLYVIQDITEHRNLEKNLAAALARSELAKQAKQAFLNSMSHQMHTPLHGILGVMQILAMDDLPPEQKVLTDEGMVAANNLLHMLDQSLQYVGLEPLDPADLLEQCSVGECMDLLLYQGAGLARQFGVEMICEVPEALAGELFSSDQPKFRQMLGIFLDNATRYNRPQGRVSLSARRDANGALVFVVSDTGSGMSPAQLAHLGEPFVRYCETERIAGSGLGLALAYRLAEVLGIKITIFSTLGECTVVTVVLPV